MPKKRILSGMRPTGPLHIGHLEGALANWRSLQDEYDCFYMVADWHALMSEYADTSMVREYSFEMVADWIASGLDPERSPIFVQSAIHEHAELFLVLSTIVPLGWLERNPTYKEAKAQIKNKDISTHAFLGYPVLQAADILLYKASCVPVGDDQLPHLEITREIARRFANFFKDVFIEPEAKLTRNPRLLGTDRRKMSKSYDNCVYLGDAPEEIARKVASMITDPKRIRKDDPGHPDECNVFDWYKLFVPDLVEERRRTCTAGEIGCVACKKILAERLTEHLRPIRERRSELLADRGELEKILERGNTRAREIARKTMGEVRDAIGF